MAVTDLLTSGSQPITTPTSSTSQTVLPDWYTNYAQQILSNQSAISANPLAVYQGPRVADFNPTQQQSFDQTAQAATGYQPQLNTATSTLNNVNPNGGLTAAQPYLTAASATAPSQVQNYMSPYLSNVVQQIGTLGNQNLQENILPSIRDKFIAGGSYGGTRNAQIFGQAVRDAQTGISNAQEQALNTGYDTSLTAAQNDLNRQATLAGTAGTLGQAGTTAALTQGVDQGNLASLTQQLGLNGASALDTTGTQQQNNTQQNLTTAYNDFLTQQQYPQVQQGNLESALTAVAPAVPKATDTSGTSVNGYTPSTLSSIAGLLNLLGTSSATSALNGIGGTLSSIFGGASPGTAATT